MTAINTEPPPTILVVDDDTLTCLMVTDILNDHGIHAIPAKCAQEALAILDDLEKKPSLIISDVDMPGMNGFELLQKIEEQHRPIKTLFMTGSSFYTEEWDYIDSLQPPVLMKPFRKSELLSHVSRILDLPPLNKCSNPA